MQINQLFVKVWYLPKIESTLSAGWWVGMVLNKDILLKC